MDINGGQLTQTNGNPILPGTTFTGPLIAGNVPHSDGSGTLAGAGNSIGTANAGYCVMAQTAVVTQAAGGGGGTGVCISPIVIPAQSQIIGIQIMVTTAWTGNATTFEVGTTAGTTAASSLSPNTEAGGSTGLVAITPSTAAQIANWDNTSNSTFQSAAADIQVQLTSANTGNGVGTLTVTYLQGVNNAS
jgi:hypothetical protein